MKRLFLTGLLLVAGTAMCGCFLFKRSSKPKENPAMATELEVSFKAKWMEKRTAELVAQGQLPDAARTQANEEFRVRYGYTHAADK